MTINLEYAIICLLGAVLILAIMVTIAEFRLSRLLRGNSGNMENVLKTVHTHVEELDDFKKEMEKYLVTVEERLQKSIQGVSVVRFNAFKSNGSGGNQSFASAFLNEKGDGVVFSGIHARDVVNVYAKPVSRYSSNYELSQEEKDAIKHAGEKKNKNK